MWVYAVVLVGVTVVALGQLSRLRHYRHRDLDPETLARHQAEELAEREAVLADALARLGEGGKSLLISHETHYGWPCFTVHLESQEALGALDLEAVRGAFAAAVGARAPAEGLSFDPELGVVFQVEGD